MMLNKRIKRFYKQAGVAAQDQGGFAVQLDGRGIKTPLARPLVVPTQALAQAVADEWHGQGEEVDPQSMPMMQLSSTALDRAEGDRATIQAEVMKFAGTDLLCYRADFPADLVDRQTNQWQPLLDWAATALDAQLVVTHGVMAVDQPVQALKALNAVLDGYDCWRLAGVQLACGAAGSLILALALAEGRLDAGQVYVLSQLDETYQIQQWGEDAEAAARRKLLYDDILAAGRFLQLLK